MIDFLMHPAGLDGAERSTAPILTFPRKGGRDKSGINRVDW
jgi:hypothetical protein